MDEIHNCFIFKHNSWLACLLKVFLLLCWFWNRDEVYTRIPGDCKNKQDKTAKQDKNGHPQDPVLPKMVILKWRSRVFPMSSSPCIFSFHNFPEGHWLQDSSHDQNISTHQTHKGRGAKGVSGGANVTKWGLNSGVWIIPPKIINPLAYVGVPPWVFASCSPP